MKMKTPIHLLFTTPRLCFAVLMLFAASQSSDAAVYYLQANQTATTFNDTTLWFDQSSGGGTTATTFDGNTFNSNGYQVRTGTGNFTFGNSATILNLSSIFLVRAGPTSGITVPNLVTFSPLSPATRTAISIGAGSVKLNATNFNMGGNTSIEAGGFSGRILTLNIGTLMGSSNLTLTDGSILQLSVTGGTGSYTGTLGFGTGVNTLNFDADFGTSSTAAAYLVANDANSRISLDQHVYFAGATINGTSLAAGDYSYSTLNATYGTIFATGNVSGILTVVPEPSTYSLLGLGLLSIWTLRRKKNAAHN